MLSERDLLRSVGHGIDPAHRQGRGGHDQEPGHGVGHRHGGEGPRGLPRASIPPPPRDGRRQGCRHPLDPSRRPGRAHRGGAACRIRASRPRASWTRGRCRGRDLGWRCARRGGVLPLPRATTPRNWRAAAPSSRSGICSSRASCRTTRNSRHSPSSPSRRARSPRRSPTCSPRSLRCPATRR